MNQVLNDFVAVGLPILPVKKDKTPMCFTTKFLDKRLPTCDDYKDMNKCYYALKSGNPQTKIECIDVDLKHVPKDYRDLAWQQFLDATECQDLVIQETPSGGYHIIYRTDTVPGSKKMAWWKGEKEAWIETRGHGGYFLIAPTPGYKVISGSLMSIPYIPQEVADDMKAACCALSQRERKLVARAYSPQARAYNAHHAGDMLAKLTGAGWTIGRELDDKWWMIRPGKDKGTGATLYKSSGYFYVFTSGTKFEPEHAYSPVDIIKVIDGVSDSDMERTVTSEASEHYLPDVINAILANSDKVPIYEMRKLLADTIIEYMEKNGKIYNDGTTGYYFSGLKMTPIDLTSDRYYSLMYHVCGMNRVDTNMKYVFEEVKNYALSRGTEITPRRYTYYDGVAVYVYNFNGRMYKITDKDIFEQDNGSDGIFFVEQAGEPVEISDNLDDGFDFNGVLFGGLTFESGEITVDEYMRLFLYWILSIFFLHSNRPIACTIGEKGSGKTVIFRKLLYMLFGGKTDVSALPEKQSDFWACVANNRLVIFDNADSHRDWLNDSLAQIATSASVNLRKLYTTNDVLQVHIDCFVGLTSRTPKFTRDDVSDRLLIFNLERFKFFTPEDSILDAVLKNRTALMTIIFGYIKQTIRLLNAHTGDMQCCTRMATFEKFCRIIDPPSVDIFGKMVETQREFSEDAFTDVMYEYCRSKASVQVFEVTKSARDLSSDLSEIAPKIGVKNMYFTSSSVAQRLKRSFDFCKVEKVKLTTGNKSVYKIVISAGYKFSENIQAEW